MSWLTVVAIGGNGATAILAIVNVVVAWRNLQSSRRNKKFMDEIVRRYR